MITQRLPHLIVTRGSDFAATQRSAAEAMALIETISPEIERHTAAVCIRCPAVCCLQKHSRYDLSDTIFLSAMGLPVPGDTPEIEESAPCRFLDASGCSLKRSLRPFRCTWFFCSPLLDHIVEQSSPPAYREFMRTLEKITETRIAMMRHFEEAEAKISAVCLQAQANNLLFY